MPTENEQTIRLNGIRYRLNGPIIRTNVNDFPPQIGSGNQAARVDMSLAQHWTVDDFTPLESGDTVLSPGGFGLETVRNNDSAQLAADSNRFWDSTVDTRFRKQVTLAPLVQTTATTGGRVPSHMFDFLGSTYAGVGVSSSAETVLENGSATTGWANTLDAVAPGTSYWQFPAQTTITMGIDTTLNVATNGVYTKTFGTTQNLSIFESLVCKIGITTGYKAKLSATTLVRWTFSSAGGDYYVDLAASLFTDGALNTVRKTRPAFTSSGSPDWTAITTMSFTWYEAASPSNIPVGGIQLNTVTGRLAPAVLKWDGAAWQTALSDILTNGVTLEPVGAHNIHTSDSETLYLYVWLTDPINGPGVSGGSNFLWRTSDGASWTHGDHVGCVGLTFNNDLYKIDTLVPYARLMKCAAADSPIVGANWAEVMKFREANSPLQLVQHYNATGEIAMFMGARDGIYAIDVTNTRYYYAISYQKDNAVARAMVSWPTGNPAGIYYSVSGGGVECYNPEQKEVWAVGPNLDHGLPSTVQGDVVSLLPLRNWLLALVRNGTTSACILARHRKGGWHMLVSGLGRCDCMHYSSATTIPRLYFGNGTAVNYIEFPDISDNPYQYSGTSRYQATGYHDLPAFEGRFSEVPKLALEVRVVAEGLNTATSNTEKIEVQYQVDDDTAWTSLGTVYSDTADGKLQFASGAGVAFHRDIRFRRILSRGATNTNTPRIRFMDFKYIDLPAPRYQWEMVLDCTTATKGRKPQGLIAAVRAAAESETLVQFYEDESSTAYYVKVLDIRENWPGKVKDGGATVRLTVAEVA